MLRLASAQYQVVLVVVCLPELRARDTSPVWAPASGTSRLIKVLLPTPDGPSTRVVRPASQGPSAMHVEYIRRPEAYDVRPLWLSEDEYAALVDYVLAPADMPAQLIAYARYAFDPKRKAGEPALADGMLKKACMLLRAQSESREFEENVRKIVAARVVLSTIGSTALTRPLIAWPGIAAAPKGVRLDTAEEIAKKAGDSFVTAERLLLDDRDPRA